MAAAPKDKINITIRLAEAPPLPLQINRDEEPRIRTAEYHVNQLWKSWSRQFPDKSAYEILAMTAFQFAKLYVGLNDEAEQTGKVLEQLDGRLDRLISDIDAIVAANADGANNRPSAETPQKAR